MRILKDGKCEDEKRQFSDVYNLVKNNLDNNPAPIRAVYIPLFTDDELDVLDADFDYYENDIDEREIENMIMHYGEKLALRIVDTYDPVKRKFRVYFGDGTHEDVDVTIQKPY